MEVRKIKRLVAVLVSLVIGCAVALVGTTPAHAANTYPNLRICNSQHSVGPLQIYSSSLTAGRTLYVGTCSYYWNGDGSVRVDPDPEYGYPDVDSTWWAYEWQSGYPYCINGESRIDPPNYYEDEIYYNTDKSGC